MIIIIIIIIIIINNKHLTYCDGDLKIVLI